MCLLKGELQDLFQFTNGQRVHSLADWRRRRIEMQNLLLDIEYDPLPPQPTAVHAVELHHTFPVTQWLDAYHYQYRIAIEEGVHPFWFTVDILTPQNAGKYPSTGNYPVIINGDGCWDYVTDQVKCEVLRRGYVLALFNRTEIVPDNYHSDRKTGLYLTYPHTPFQALGAWAWGYHRVVDFLLMQKYIDPSKIAITGHSRGGKAVLLAGAVDERIALTAPNNSGSGGAGSFRWQGPSCETLADGLAAVPYWYSPRLKQYINREDELPFDQHFLKSLVAPRGLLSTEALADDHANPMGTYQTYLAAREAYRFLQCEDRMGIWYRQGEHEHSLADWKAFLDFADFQFCGLTSSSDFRANPFPDLPKAYSWSAPKTGGFNSESQHR